MIFGGTSNRVLDYSLTAVKCFRKIININDIEMLTKDLNTLGGMGGGKMR